LSKQTRTTQTREEPQTIQPSKTAIQTNNTQDGAHQKRETERRQQENGRIYMHREELVEILKFLAQEENKVDGRSAHKVFVRGEEAWQPCDSSENTERNERALSHTRASLKSLSKVSWQGRNQSLLRSYANRVRGRDQQDYSEELAISE